MVESISAKKESKTTQDSILLLFSNHNHHHHHQLIITIITVTENDANMGFEILAREAQGEVVGLWS